MANNSPNIEGINKYSKEKTETAIRKVDEALKKMIRKQVKINFNAVSEHSGASKGFLYKNSDLRGRIEMLRKQQEGLPSAKQVKRHMSDSSKDVVIATLKQRVQKLEKENSELKEQLKFRFGDLYNQI
ncbi:hypothetical protein QFZ77_005259 [Paenibacillus sp. V4I3]|uniref:DUF6262 family protein n=1 Tax=Paenibacillus sp. V4I3 TaxID=3042305 RepID=UPI0027827DCA|nr:DUF6262 family protein [Paenibacillus sp. V4I3]MDQ0876600.1 hypothetical protein [Paenibacillus sp. V4I3]